jgi:hypothetical protein
LNYIETIISATFRCKQDACYENIIEDGSIYTMRK